MKKNPKGTIHLRSRGGSYYFVTKSGERILTESERFDNPREFMGKVVKVAEEKCLEIRYETYVPEYIIKLITRRTIGRSEDGKAVV